MRLDEPVGPAEPLSAWLGRLGSLPGDGNLLVPHGIGRLTLDTPCRPVLTGGRDMSPQEQDELDALIEQAGLHWFLGEHQLEEVLANVREQAGDAAPDLTLAAVRYYWENDAFLIVKSA